jgi:thiamine biosynthesis lipoprotein
MFVCGALVMAALAAQTSTAPSASATPAPSAAATSLAPGNPAPGTDGASVPVAPVARRHGHLVGDVMVDLILMLDADASAEVSAGHADAAFAELARVQAAFDPDGPGIGAINRSAGGEAVLMDPEVFAVLVEIDRIARLSRGAFDPTAAAYASLWTDGDVPAAVTLKARRAVVGLSQLVLDPVRRTARLISRGARIDVAAVARGYGLDRARGILIERGVKAFVLSGNGGAPWMVGVQDPRAAGPFLTIALNPLVLGGAVMTAADTDGASVVDGKRRHRLLDPKTGLPARVVRSATVLDSDALTAACLARAIFVMGPRDGLDLAARLKGPEVVVVGADNRVMMSPGLKKLQASGGLKQRQPTDGP